MDIVRKIDRIAIKLIPVGLILLPFSLLVGYSIDLDTWWHLADGRWMVENHRILFADPFSFTRLGAAWAHPGYPFEIVLYLLYNRLGEIGADLLACAILSVTFLILWIVLKASPIRKLVLIGVAMLVSSSYWSARPNLFALLFSVITLAILEKYRTGSRRSLWLMPLVVLIWANLHGSFILAFLFLGIYAVDHLRDRARLIPMILTGVVMLLATLGTPYGLGVYGEMLNTTGRVAENSLIIEWQSPDFHQAYGLIFLGAVLMTMVLMGLNSKKLSLTHLLLPIALIALALYSARNIAVFGVSIPFIWNTLLPEEATAEKEAERPRPWLTGLSLGLLVFSLVTSVTRISANVQTYNPQQKNVMPVGSVSYLKTIQPVGHLFNAYGIGGYLIWSLPKNYPVFVDSRSDIYGDEIILQSITIENALPGWDALLDQWNIRTIITSPSSALSYVLKGNANWQQCYHEPGYVVLIKAEACPVPLDQ